MKAAFNLIMTILILANSPSLAGHDVGTGIDSLKPENGSVWFVGSSKVISYCIKTAENFGATEAEIDKAFNQARVSWRNYFTRVYGVSEEWPLPSFQAVKSDCTDTTDLTLYMGVETEAIKLLKQIKYHRPTAFAHRQTFSTKTGWGKGFIWVASRHSVSSEESYPDWKLSYTLQGVLLHELGHVYGSEHIPGTIMSSNLDLDLKEKDENIRKIALTHIDGNLDLAPCKSCGFSYGGSFGTLSQGLLLIDESTLAFKALTCEEPVGKIRSKLSGFSDGGWPGKMTLTFSDEVATHVRNLKFPDIGSVGTSPRFTLAFGEAMAMKFLAPQPEFPSSVTVFGYPRMGKIFHATLTGCDEREIVLNVEQQLTGNGEQGPIALKFFHSGKTRGLFRAYSQRESILGPIESIVIKE